MVIKAPIFGVRPVAKLQLSVEQHEIQKPIPAIPKLVSLQDADGTHAFVIIAPPGYLMDVLMQVSDFGGHWVDEAVEFSKFCGQFMH